MSADLFAAFGQPQSSQKIEDKSPSEAKFTGVTSKHAHSGFEDHEQWILQSRPVQEYLKTETQQQGPLWKQNNKGADVLFDASDDDQDGDDFGDFEEAAIEVRDKEAIPSLSAHRPSHQISTDLLGLDDFSSMQIAQSHSPHLASGAQNLISSDLLESEQVAEHHSHGNESYWEDSQSIWTQPESWEKSSGQMKHQKATPPPAIISPVDDDWGNFEGAETHTASWSPTMKPKSPVDMASIERDLSFEEDEWEAFEETDSAMPPPSMGAVNHAITNKSNPKQPRSQPQSQLDTPTTCTTTSQPSISQPRPTNIPPPSTLLQLLPKIYHTLSQQSRLPTPPPQLALQILQVYTTTARIISGRTHRWKRDTLLSQSMRISQAGLKSTGMKLTALDRGETVKEDQEAQEAISAWQRHAAVLNATMLKAKVQKPPMSLSQNMAVRAASGPGVLTARECCAVCGLKRNERVTGIDVKVEDTFGEFWSEHWGHRDCYEFWYEYEGLLNKR